MFYFEKKSYRNYRLLFCASYKQDKMLKIICYVAVAYAMFLFFQSDLILYLQVTND